MRALTIPFPGLYQNPAVEASIVVRTRGWSSSASSLGGDAWIAAAFTVAFGEGMQPIEIGMTGLRRATTAASELSSVDCALGTS